MRNTLVLLALLVIGFAGGCATVTSGLCWVDKQIPACEWAEEQPQPKDDANDVLPGNGG